MSNACAITIGQHYRLIYDEMSRCASGDSIWIATYGVSYTSGYVRKTIEDCVSEGFKLRLLIGPTSMTEEQSFGASIQRRYLDDCHLKCWLFKRKRGADTAIVGGRNLNSSNWHDFSALLDNRRQVDSLITHYKDLWLRGRQEMNTGLVHELFESQETD